MFGRSTAAPRSSWARRASKGRGSVRPLPSISHAARRADILEAYPHLRLEPVEQPVPRATESFEGDAVLTREAHA